MREIKFRAWDKTKREMVVGEYYNLVSFEGDTYQFKLGKLLKASEFELMQFTGLSDENGKEIYEGDIVTFRKWFDDDGNDDEKTYSGTIIFQDCGCGFGYFIDSPVSKNGSNLCLLSNDFEIEVIGNIYENPELLKEIK